MIWSRKCRCLYSLRWVRSLVKKECLTPTSRRSSNNRISWLAYWSTMKYWILPTLALSQTWHWKNNLNRFTRWHRNKKSRVAPLRWAPHRLILKQQMLAKELQRKLAKRLQAASSPLAPRSCPHSQAPSHQTRWKSARKRKEERSKSSHLGRTRQLWLVKSVQRWNAQSRRALLITRISKPKTPLQLMLPQVQSRLISAARPSVRPKKRRWMYCKSYWKQVRWPNHRLINAVRKLTFRRCSRKTT